MPSHAGAATNNGVHDQVPPEAVFSMDALQRAWRMARQNGQSPGIDRVTPAQFERRLEPELRRLREEILGGSYRPQPVQRYYRHKQ